MNKHVRNGIALAAAGMAIGATIFSSPTGTKPTYTPATPAARTAPTKTQAANEFLHAFPDSFPEAREVKKYETPDAKYCLVHIRQAHLNINKILREADLKRAGLPLSDDTLVQKELTARINDIQRDIYQIEKELYSRYGRLNLYTDGLAQGVEIDAQKASITHLGLLQRLAFLGYIDPQQELKYEQRLGDKKFVHTKVEEFEKFKYAPGADCLLRAEEKIRLVGWEDPEIMRRGNVLSSRDFNIEAKSNSEGREDRLLDKITSYDDIFAVTDLGALHALGGKKSCGPEYSLAGRLSTKDNLEVWNKNNPKKRVSLIELTPRAYEEVDPSGLSLDK